MLAMFSAHYISKSYHVDGAKRRRFRIKPGRRRKPKPLVDCSVDPLAALQASWEAAARLADATGLPHHIRGAAEARERILSFAISKQPEEGQADSRNVTL